jgi:phosphatidylcholine synthase
LIAAAGMAVAIIDHSFRLAFLLMLIATAIDATDGALARLVRVKEVLPGFDGRRLDDLIDFQTYTSLPLLLIWQSGILPPGTNGVLIVPLLASAYGFSQTSVKTDDGYFLGFPSLWNLVAFYLYALQPLPAGLSLGLLLILSLLTFVPTRYIYATQRGPLSRLTNWLGTVWAGLVIWILWIMPDELPSTGWDGPDGLHALVALSLVFPVYYLVASWGISLRIWKAHRPRSQKEPSGGR